VHNPHLALIGVDVGREHGRAGFGRGDVPDRIRERSRDRVGSSGAEPEPAVNSEVAYVGAVGTVDHVEFTALGDAVNACARLATEAGPGELLAAVTTADATGVVATGLEHRRLALCGKTEATDVVVLDARTG
jgi:class 3 adenylate cyclase